MPLFRHALPVLRAGNNVLFIHDLISFSCFGLLEFLVIEELISGRFTDVQPEIRPEVTRRVWKTTDATGGFPRWRLTQTPYNLDVRFNAPGPATAGRATFLYPCYPRNPW
jgi:hypothetical protein